MRAGDALGIGEMKHRIIFKKIIVTVNENGFEVEEWQDFKAVWSKVSNLSGREYYQAAAVQAEKTLIFLIRYIDGIDTSMRIQFNNRQYNIIFIDNMKYSKTYIELKAMEVIQNG